jgi:hypothetical protein
LGENRYLDVVDGRKVVIKTKNGRSSQMWYFDQKTLSIKSKMNNQALNIERNGVYYNMEIQNANDKWWQHFKFDGKHFINPFDQRKKYVRALDVHEAEDKEGQLVKANKFNKNKNQQWRVIYVDDAEETRTKGLNKNFGFHINRPFYIVSRLPMQRVVEAIGANDMRLRRYIKGRVAQQYYFDEVSKTIRSQQWKNYCIEIQSNGSSKEIRMTSGINSRWW